MKRLVLVVVLALIFSFGGAGLSAAAIETPTWTTGDTWTYRGFVGQSLTFTVLGPAGDGYSVEVKSASGMNILHYSRDLVTESADYFKPQWPLEVGKQWQFTTRGQATNLRQGSTNEWTTTETVAAEESVTVPAGTFQAVRIRGRQCNTTQGGCGEFDLWYAPQVKYFVKITLITSTYWSSAGRSEELVSYTVH